MSELCRFQNAGCNDKNQEYLFIDRNYINQDWSLYTCLTQLYGGRDMYNLLHKEQLHVSALLIGHLQVDK